MRKFLLASFVALMAFAPVYAFAGSCCEKPACACPAGTDCAATGCQCGCHGAGCGK